MSDEKSKNLPDKYAQRNSSAKKFTRASMQAAGGMIPVLGGFLSAAAGLWSEKEQGQVNKVFEQWLQMLEDEMREKGQTLLEIMSRLDMNEEKVRERIESPEYQSLLRKSFRNWSSIDSEDKRIKVRNILSNAAATRLSTDDVVALFIEWLVSYSDFHFEVIGEVYRNHPIGRGDIWSNLNRPTVQENSADADLYKLLIRDLSQGSIIRQKREVDYYGNFVKQSRPKSKSSGSGNTLKSAFDNNDLYELTELGKQFVHYAMNELAPRISFSDDLQEEGD